MAVYATTTGREPHQTREPRGLSPSGGKTPANLHVPLCALHGSAAQKWVQGFSPARPASREARCRAAVKPRPSRMSLYAPARLHRAEVGCRALALPDRRAARPIAERR